MIDFAAVGKSMKSALLKASAKIRYVVREGYDVHLKDDRSPVTDADYQSDQIIREELSKFPEIGFLSEEEKDDKARLEKEAIFVVDPLDGTQDFISHSPYYAVNLALAFDHHPVISYIAFPAFQSYCYAYKGKGAYYVDKEGKETRLHVSSRVRDLVWLASATHENSKEVRLRKKNAQRIHEVIYLGASVKAYYLASGKGDVSVRFTDKTKEWDVCAPDLLVKEAGGLFGDTKGREFLYNRKDVYNRDGYCMFNRIETAGLLPTAKFPDPYEKYR